MQNDIYNRARFFAGKLNYQLFILIFLVATITFYDAGDARSQEPTPPAATEQNSEPKQTVEVEPTADDSDIAKRLTRILISTEWFEDPQVKVRDGVVFLSGSTSAQKRKEWASELAQKTRDVVAVVNKMVVLPRPTWDFTPALAEITTMVREFIQALPQLLLAIVILVIAWFAARLVSWIAQLWLSTRLASPLLVTVVAKAIAIPFFLIGLYIILQLSGLTRLALTVVGGTGVIGIIFGFAFRDIAENFLASILLSIRRPFLTDDIIEVDGHTGLVRNMNTRTTVLMTPNGNHVQIPNATVFKSTIVNYTTNPNYRADFLVSIGYDFSITQAQEIIHRVMQEQDAVLSDPAPMILVDELGSSSVNLRVYFWFDYTRHSPIKLSSLLMRRALRELERSGITAPDEAREIVFPDGVPLTRVEDNTKQQQPCTSRETERPPAETEDPTSRTEGGLESEREILQEQDERSRRSDDKEDLLRSNG
jgi:small conductance mechanosensitive channel